MVLLCSGGLDSVCLGLWRPPKAIVYIELKMPAARPEKSCARHLATYLNIPFYTVKTNLSYSTPEGFFPFRNWFLVAAAVPIAEKLGIDSIALGLVGDEALFPDTTNDWIERVNLMLEYEDIKVKVVAPALALTKKELVLLAKYHHSGYNLNEWTHSCFYEKPCGKCLKCQNKAEALKGLYR